MPQIDDQSIRHLGVLSHIAIKEEEIPELIRHMQRILGYFDELATVDITDLPTGTAIELGDLALRDDVPKAMLDRSLFLANAPDKIGSHIRIPPLFQQT